MIAREVVAFLDIDGDEFPLRKETYLIGRKMEEEDAECPCDILLRCVSVSVKHSILDLSHDQFQIMDLKTKCGTFLDGEQLPKLIYMPFGRTTRVKFGELQGKIRLAECDDEENRRQSPNFICPSQKQSSFTNLQMNNAAEKSIASPDCNDNEVPVGKCNGSTKQMTGIEKICAHFNSKENEKHFSIENTSNDGDSFTIPETQYFPNSVNHFDENTNLLDSGDSFLVPETQAECLSIAKSFNVAHNDNSSGQSFNFENCSQTNTKAQESCDFPNIQSPDDDMITVSQIRICTQDFNEMDLFDEAVNAENNSNDLLANIPNSLAIPCDTSNPEHQQSANVYNQENHSSSLRDNGKTLGTMESFFSKVNESIQVAEIVEKQNKVETERPSTIETQVFVAGTRNLNTVENENSIDPEIFNKHKRKQINKSIEINELEKTQIFKLPDKENETNFDEFLPPTQLFNQHTEQQHEINNDNCEIKETQLFKVPLKKSKPIVRTIEKVNSSKTASVDMNQVEMASCNDEQFSKFPLLSQVIQESELENNDNDDELQLTQIFNAPPLHEPGPSEIESFDKNVNHSSSSKTLESPLSVNQTNNGFNEKEKSPFIINMNIPECTPKNYHKKVIERDFDGFMCTPKLIAEKFIKVVDTNISKTYLVSSDDDDDNDDDDIDVIQNFLTTGETKQAPSTKFEELIVRRDESEKHDLSPDKKRKSNKKSELKVKTQTRVRNAANKNDSNLLNLTKRAISTSTPTNRSQSSHSIESDIPARRITRLMSRTDSVSAQPAKILNSKSNAPANEKHTVSFDGGESKKKTRLSDKKIQEKSTAHTKSRKKADISSTKKRSSLYAVETINLIDDEDRKRKNQDNSLPLKRTRRNDSIEVRVPMNDKEIGKRRQFKVCVSMVDPHLLSELQTKSKGHWIIVDDPTKCDFLVMNKGNRTYKFLIAMAKGIPIVTSEWLDQLNKFEFSSRVHSTDYLFYDPAFEKRHRFQIQESLQAARSCPLFDDIQFLTTTNIRPTAKEIEEIIKCSGGIFLHETTEIDKNKKVFLVSNVKDNIEWHKFRRQCKNITIISSEGVMASVIRQNLRPLYSNVLS